MIPIYGTGLDAEHFLADGEPHAVAARSPSFPTEESSFNDKDSLSYRERRQRIRNRLGPGDNAEHHSVFSLRRTMGHKDTFPANHLLYML